MITTIQPTDRLDQVLALAQAGDMDAFQGQNADGGNIGREAESSFRIVSKEARRPAGQEIPLDLCRDCPVCGQPYRSGEPILALTCLSFAPSSGLIGSRDSDKIVLGHHGCVLPRLLTLLAGFQPEIRFVKAANEALIHGLLP